MDLWTSGSSDPYISFTVHYMVQVHSHSLRTIYLAKDHTGENIKDSLLEVLKEWSQDEKYLVAVALKILVLI